MTNEDRTIAPSSTVRSTSFHELRDEFLDRRLGMVNDKPRATSRTAPRPTSSRRTGRSASGGARLRAGRRIFSRARRRPQSRLGRSASGVRWRRTMADRYADPLRQARPSRHQPRVAKASVGARRKSPLAARVQLDRESSGLDGVVDATEPKDPLYVAARSDFSSAESTTRTRSAPGRHPDNAPPEWHKGAGSDSGSERDPRCCPGPGGPASSPSQSA